VRWVDWQSFTRRLSQIWLKIREKNSKTKSNSPSLCTYRLTCKNLWSKYGNFIKLFPPKYGDDFGSCFFQKHAFYQSQALFFWPFCLSLSLVATCSNFATNKKNSDLQYSTMEFCGYEMIGSEVI